ncbi:hypothetical protein JXA56_03090 [Candidatus Micrarchaeota archaeon]|nr:hypothetical protein [Candidatus Micrarchaeota archaeon]
MYIESLLKKLSSKSVMERKKAIRDISSYLGHREGYLARLSLHYISLHDPCYTVRNTARQAFYKAGIEPAEDAVWDKTYLF